MVLKREHAAESSGRLGTMQIAGPPTRSSGSSALVGPGNLHSYQVPRRCGCCGHRTSLQSTIIIGVPDGSVN